MSKPISRRDTLKRLSSAGAGVLSCSNLIKAAPDSPIQIAGRDVEISVTSVGPKMVRISVVPLENGKLQPIPQEGTLLGQEWPKPVARVASLGADQAIRSGDLRVKLQPV